MSNKDRKPEVKAEGTRAIEFQLAKVKRLSEELADEKSVLRSLYLMHDFIETEVLT